MNNFNTHGVALLTLCPSEQKLLPASVRAKIHKLGRASQLLSWANPRVTDFLQPPRTTLVSPSICLWFGHTEIRRRETRRHRRRNLLILNVPTPLY